MIHKNFIILAHTNPTQLKRLVDRLTDGHSSFCIHIDKKCKLDEFTDHLSHYNNVAFVTKRYDCTWGDYNTVLATMECVTSVLRDQKPGSHIFLISGQDYPIKSTDHFDAFLRENSQYDFMNFTDISDASHPLYQERLASYKFNRSSRRGDYILIPPLFSVGMKRAMRILREIASGRMYRQSTILRILTHRKSIFVSHYKGPQWWAMRYETLSKVHRFWKNNQCAMDSFYRFSLLPDELVFQTLLKKIMESDASIQIRPYLHHVNWTREGCSLPVTFGDGDFEEIYCQPEEKLLARKFDINGGEALLNRIDKEILQK